jgi:hypothetical protein
MNVHEREIIAAAEICEIFHELLYHHSFPSLLNKHHSCHFCLSHYHLKRMQSGVGGVRYLQEKGKTNNVAINLFLPKRGTASEVAGCKGENYCMK